jgi:AraC family transcriptional regulator, regulatory protein of adaptative response / methylated-DNA-[protein]-cysteine methyltransferase
LSQQQSIPQAQLDLVRRVCRYIEDNIQHGTPTLEDLSQQVHMSSYHLQRVFKQVMGITPRQYAEAKRMGTLKNHLRACDSVTDALYEAGYSSTSRLYEGAPEKLGMTPATYRSGGAGMDIHYTIAECPLGLILVATTERGICCVLLGEDEADLERRLREEFPAAEISRSHNELCDWVGALVEHLNGWRPHLDLPLDLQVTAFEWRVLHELLAIPYGETRTYSEIAAAIGQPNATRAVARVCATNPVPVAIPCHRVVRKDGKPATKYAGGNPWRKLFLLEQERKQALQSSHVQDGDRSQQGD